jgi:hypothetical protein
MRSCCSLNLASRCPRLLCSVPGVDRDGVADPEPSLEEHEQPGDHVHQEPLSGEPNDDCEGRGYRKHEAVDVVYEIDGRRTVATGLELRHY